LNVGTDRYRGSYLYNYIHCIVIDYKHKIPLKQIALPVCRFSQQ
jgi:hypothetical protein